MRRDLSSIVRAGFAASLMLAATLMPPDVMAQGTPKLGIPASDDGLPGVGPIRRQDWFQKLWLQRRTEWAANADRDRHSLVFLGDSITQGWGDRMGDAFPGIKVSNRGISGDTSRGVLIRLAEDVLALKPTAVVLLIGTNDLEENASPETIASNVEQILNLLRQHDPHLPVILCEVFPSSASMRRPADKIRKLNQLYAGLAKGRSQVTRAETWALFADANGDAKAAEFPDLLHPNAIGYSKWAAALRPLLATLGFLETKDDAFTPEPGFTSLFNGRDLTGWGFKTNRFDGLTQSTDGRYHAKHGRMIVTTPTEGRRVQQIWTTREFPKNFTLKLEFRATPTADSGIFIRQPQLQCRDYPLAGPYKSLKNYKPQDWNEVVIVVRNGTAHCTCNGEVLEAALPVPPTGPIGLEGDSGQMEYRRIRLREEP